MASITDKKGNVILFDDADADLVHSAPGKWYVGSRGYVMCSFKVDGKQKSMYLHRYLLGLKVGDRREGDHDDRNKLNNTRLNLRICNRQQNNCNVGKHRDNRSGFKGVTYVESAKKWMSQIGHNGKNLFLGHFNSPEDAHSAYCKAARELHGQFANYGQEV